MIRLPLINSRFGARATLLRGASVLALAAGGALLAVPARADTPMYQGPITNGNWSNAANWSTLSVPNSGSDTTVNNGQVVSTDGNNSTSTLTVGPMAGSGVNISDNTVLNVGGAIVNQGVITLNSAGDGTELRTTAGGTITLSGGGTLQLSNNGNNLIRDTASGTGSLVNVDNKIQGSGNIGVNALSLTNQAGGTITANQGTPLLIQTNSAGTSNAGLLQANGGTLNINGSSVTQTGAGTILGTNGSTVLLTNTTVSGGTLTTTSGGAIASAGSGATLANVTVSTGSTYTTSDNTVTTLVGTIVNNGTLALSSVGDGTELRTQGGATVTLTGGGTVQLSNNSNNYIRDTTSSTGTLVNVNNTIQGSGNIGLSALGLVNQVGGTVTANQATQLYIQTNGAGTSNAGLLQANGGTLNINGSSVTQTGTGVILGTNGSTVLLTNTTVSGGTLTTTSGGAIASAGSGATLANVTVSTGSTYTTSDNTVTTLVGTIVNNGTLALSSVGDGTELRTQGGATVTLTGGGTVQLSNNGSNLIRDTTSGTGVLVNVNNTIQGTGNIGVAGLSVDNQAAGVIDANRANSTLTIQANSAGVSNEGALRASAGLLNIVNTGVTQTGAGSIIANGGTVQLQNSAVSGGTIGTTSGGTLTSTGTNNLTNTTITAGSTYNIQNGSATYINGTITNNGTVALNSGGDGTELRVTPGGSTTLTGGGVVSLSGSSANYIRDYNNGTGSLVNVNNTIQGGGQVGVGALGIDNQAAGTITANLSGTTLTLQANSSGVSNEGALRASSGGLLNIVNTTVTQSATGSTVAAAGGTVQLSNSTIMGGTIGNAATGTLTSTGTNNLTNTTITAGSTYNIQNGSATYINGTITNNGTIALNSGGDGTELRVTPGGSTTLTGGGTVQLSNYGTNYIRDYDNSTGVLVNVDNTIQGGGQVGVGALGIDNRAAGTIAANSSGVTLTLQANSAGVSNEGALLGTNSGLLNIVNTTVTQSATGTILASAGGTVQLQNSTVSGGTIGNTSTGTLTSTGTNNLTNTTITAGSTYNLQDNSATYINGTIVNKGTISVNSGGDGTELRITPSGTTTLSGGGTVQLSNNINNLIRDYNASNGVLVNVDNTIQGVGQVGVGALGIVNQAGGTINANVSGGTIILQGNTYDPSNTTPTAVSNAGNLLASNGGTLDVRGTVNQTPTGVTTAATGSTVLVNNATISGGTLTTTGTGVMQTVGTSSLTGVTISAGSTYTGADNTATYLNGTINNQGTIALTSGGDGTELRITRAGRRR